MKKKIFLLLILWNLFFATQVNASTCEISENSFHTYYASDYSDVAYCTINANSEGYTLQNQGCFPLTIASILKSFGLNVTPTDVSSYLCTYHKEDAENVTYGKIINNEAFQNEFNMNITDINDTIEAIDTSLAKGEAVLASVKKPSVFANNRHYIAIVKKRGNDYYVINTSSKTDTSKISGWYSKEHIQKNVTSSESRNNGLWAISVTNCNNTTNSSTGNTGGVPCGDGLKDCYPNYFPNIGTSDNNTNCDTIFMTNGELNEFGEFLESIYLLIKIAAPVLVIVLSTIDYLKAIASSSADEMKKCNKRMVKRLIVGILIFFLPYLLDLIFHMFGLYDISRCNIG